MYTLSNMDWLKQHMPEIEGFPRPNWEEIYKDASEIGRPADTDEFWSEVSQVWIKELLSVLPVSYKKSESKNFIIVTSESDRYVSLFQSFLESCLTRILRTLPGIADDEGFGKHVVIVFDDIKRYYSYAGFYYPEEGVFGLTSGMYLNQGYGHFIFPNVDLNHSESVAAHEMTHAVLNHLPIPLWLNEGLAVSVEGLITGYPVYQLDVEQFIRHQKFWNSDKIQTFWSGHAFSRSDEGQELSYQLALLLVTSLSKDYKAFVAFTNQANWNDGGELATQNVFGFSLGELVSDFLGTGLWSPIPNTWPSDIDENNVDVSIDH